MDVVIYPRIWRKIEDIIGEALVEMSSRAQVRLIYLAKEHEQESQELSALKKILQRRKNKKQELEEITQKKSNDSDNLSIQIQIL